MGGGRDQAATPVKRKATSPKEQAAKRYQEEEDDKDAFEEAQEESDVMGDMQKELMEGGLSPKQVAMAMGIFMKGFQALVKKAAKEAVAAAIREVDRASMDAAEAAANKKLEEDRCRRSILIHNADKWVGHLSNSSGYSLAEVITVQIHKMFGQAVLVVDAFFLLDRRPQVSL